MTAHQSGLDRPIQEVTIDDDAQAAYILIHDATVAHTRPFDDDESVILDIDADGTLIGIEVLGLNTPIPIDELALTYRLPEPLTEALRSIQEILRSTAVAIADYPGSAVVPEMCTA
jgi:uncharacterized protein YuzE